MVFSCRFSDFNCICSCCLSHEFYSSLIRPPNNDQSELGLVLAVVNHYCSLVSSSAQNTVSSVDSECDYSVIAVNEFNNNFCMSVFLKTESTIIIKSESM
jgi:hypothetical protein